MNNNQINSLPFFQSSYVKPVYTYAVENYVNGMMRQDVLNEYNYYINESNYYLSQINTYQYAALKIENNQLIFQPNQNYFNNKVNSNLDNFEVVENALTKYFQKQIKIITDVEDLVKNKRLNPYIVYIPFFQIPTINYIVNYIFDIYDNRKSYTSNTVNYHNFFTYTDYLKERFEPTQEYKITLDKITANSLYDAPIEDENIEKDYFLWRFLLALTANKENSNYEYILNYIRHFFKTLRRVPEALILIENKDVSEDILYNKIIRPIFEPAGLNYCTTITDGILETKSIDEIVANKLFIHINHIPQNEVNKDKLKKLLIKLLTQKSIDMGNYEVAIQAQIIFTLDKPDSFLNDFLSSSKVLFIDSLENIQSNLNQDDELAIHKNIYENMTLFAKQLAALSRLIINNFNNELSNHEQDFVKEERLPNFSSIYIRNDTNKFSSSEYKADNEIFKKMINNPDFVNFSMAYSNEKPELNPFENEKFEKLIPLEERLKHTYVTGKTGSGKSELLKTLMYADIQRENSSVILLDIHGDLAQSVSKLVEDKERLLLIDPTLHKGKTPTINLFDLKDKSDENIEQVTQMISSVIKSVSSEDKFSGTMMDFLENCISVLLRKGNSDIFELKQFMNSGKTKKANNETVTKYDPKTAKLIELAKNSDDPFVNEYFNNEFDSVKNETKNAIKRRLNKILKDSMFFNLVNGKSKIDLEKEINTKGKIIIFKIPKAKMLNTYAHYIKFIIGFTQIVALKRADIKNEKNRPHTHLYIDEFHNFITPTIEEILTESRKYKLFLTVAHQSISQIKEVNLRDIILDNTNVKIIGKNSNKTLDAMNKTLNEKLEDVENLQAGEFYIKAGNNALIKIQNTDKLIGDNESISNEKWQESKQYQLEQYYRDVIRIETPREKEEELNKCIDKFIEALLILDRDYFKHLLDNDRKFLKNFNNEEDDSNEKIDDGADGYIAQPRLYEYFNKLHPELDDIKNDIMLDKFKEDKYFSKQKPDDDSKRFNQKRYKIVLKDSQS